MGKDIQKLKVGICEWHYHHQYIKTLQRLCKNHEVVTYDYLPRNPDVDILFVNTVQNLPMDWVKFIGWNPRCKTVLTVHEANSELRWNPILKKFDAIAVTYEPIKEYAKKYYKGKIFTIPFALFEGHPERSFYNPYYVVPGRIESFRRDYSLLEGYEPICYLGCPVGKRGRLIVKRADLYFDDFVPQYLYDDILRGCRAVVAPLRNPTKGTNRVTREYYGVTKCCGAMFEAVRFGKPFVCNLPIIMDYKDYTVKIWRKYFEEEVLML